MTKTVAKKRDFEVTEEMFIGAIDALFGKKEQEILRNIFSTCKKDGGDKCRSRK